MIVFIGRYYNGIYNKIKQKYLPLDIIVIIFLTGYKNILTILTAGVRTQMRSNAIQPKKIPQNKPKFRKCLEL